MDRPLPWLRYVAADKVQAPELFFDGMKVRNDAMETLGTVDGFIVDNSSMRPYYVVVDSGGWFKSKNFLVPIGHAKIDDDRDAIVVDLAKSRIERFPGFDRNEFERLDEAEIARMNDTICEACRDASTVYTPADPLSPAWGAPEFTQPEWWARSVTGFEGSVEPVRSDDTYVVTEDYPATKVGRAMGELQAEQMIAREQDREGGVPIADDRIVEDRIIEQSERDRVRERVRAAEPEVSPHDDGRAQPGDVLGLETGGERTHVGETTEDENKRRIDAERDYDKRRG